MGITPNKLTSSTDFSITVTDPHDIKRLSDLKEIFYESQCIQTGNTINFEGVETINPTCLVEVADEINTILAKYKPSLQKGKWSALAYLSGVPIENFDLNPSTWHEDLPYLNGRRIPTAQRSNSVEINPHEPDYQGNIVAETLDLFNQEYSRLHDVFSSVFSRSNLPLTFGIYANTAIENGCGLVFKVENRNSKYSFESTDNLELIEDVEACKLMNETSNEMRKKIEKTRERYKKNLANTQASDLK